MKHERLCHDLRSGNVISINLSKVEQCWLGLQPDAINVDLPESTFADDSSISSKSSASNACALKCLLK